ncbi:DNA-binding protein [Capsulimonas corticalis]|uniref:DNA-binding protein n=1 Tax=Capsulimonas corticalis TaxID=2219043 RepID=A0A402CTB1_9BACT|nr:type II toxin-antitoxin system VapC family toxin [Capsulimonas corticalis]BDI30808.1 DNA-binding protein [Capsulimonas corticalis]
MNGTLVDSNVLLDVLTSDSQWSVWSSNMLDQCSNGGPLCINPIIFAEVSVSFGTIEDVEAAIPEALLRRLDLPLEAAFLAGKAFLRYRQQGGTRTSTMPDFFIGAHAAVTGLRLLTRDDKRYRTYFPTIDLLSP